MKDDNLFQVGPYPAFAAEWVTERTLESDYTAKLLNQWQQGQITKSQFANNLMFLVESLHSDFIKEQIELRRQASNE